MTGKEIFDIAIHLLDEQNESTGSTETADTKEYELRSVSLINSFLPRLCLQSGVTVSAISALSDTIPADTALAQGVAPYFLAALLIETETPELAIRLKSEGDENYSEIRGRLSPAEFEDIEQPYGGIDDCEYGSWV